MQQRDREEAGETRPRGPLWALRNIEMEIAAFALFLFIVFSTAQMVSRYFLNSPLAWVEEVSMIILIWMTFIGAVWLVRKDQHIRVELLDELGYPRVRTVLYTLYDLASIAFLILLAIGGYQLIDLMSWDRTPALQIPYSFIVSIVPVTAALMAVGFVLQIVRRLKAAGVGKKN